MNTRKLYVSGLVQGVGFRYHTCHEAIKLGLSGYAKNLNDGRVEVVAQGRLTDIEALTNWLKVGPRFSNVSSVVHEDAELRVMRGFEIL